MNPPIYNAVVTEGTDFTETRGSRFPDGRKTFQVRTPDGLIHECSAEIVTIEFHPEKMKVLMDGDDVPRTLAEHMALRREQPWWRFWK